MNMVTLPPDLERFADDVVARGRFRDIDEVVRTALALLQQAESYRAQLLVSVLAAEAEGDRDGYLTDDDVIARVEARLAKARASGA
jgi:antitoxin ParD1/3/4